MRPFDSHPDELISASLTGDLTDIERRELEAHLSSCQACRETLEAFTQQRQLLGGLPVTAAPRDLGPRIRTSIASGRFGAPWWRRPGGVLAGVGALGAVAGAGLLAVFFLNGGLKNPQVGSSIPPSGTAVASTSPTPPSSGSPASSATPAPLPLGMKPGDLTYVSLTGPKENRKLEVIRDASGHSVSVINPAQFGWGQPQRATLSPDGRMLAFATLLDGKGTWIFFATDLSTGKTVQLGESFPQAFGHRLLWSPEGRYLAFTVESVPQGGTSDVWIFDRSTGDTKQVTKAGNAYAASWAPIADGRETLWISLGAADPTSVAAQFPAIGGLSFDDLLATPLAKADGVFMPLLSPDGQKAVFWRGTMALAGDGQTGWIFSTGGLPQLTNSGSGGIPRWTSGAALFGDLQADQGGQAFASGDVTWADDSDTYTFWGGLWNGTPEGANYPDQNAVYGGHASQGPLTRASALALGGMTTHEGDQLAVVDVALSPDGKQAAVTLVYPTPEFGAAAFLRTTPTTAGGKPREVGSAGITPPPWLGPAAYVPGATAP